jgi:hypothetical protein
MQKNVYDVQNSWVSHIIMSQDTTQKQFQCLAVNLHIFGYLVSSVLYLVLFFSIFRVLYQIQYYLELL